MMSAGASRQRGDPGRDELQLGFARIRDGKDKPALERGHFGRGTPPEMRDVESRTKAPNPRCGPALDDCARNAEFDSLILLF